MALLPWKAGSAPWWQQPSTFPLRGPPCRSPGPPPTCSSGPPPPCPPPTSESLLPPLLLFPFLPERQPPTCLKGSSFPVSSSSPSTLFPRCWLARPRASLHQTFPWSSQPALPCSSTPPQPSPSSSSWLSSRSHMKSSHRTTGGRTEGPSSCPGQEWRTCGGVCGRWAAVVVEWG